MSASITPNMPMSEYLAIKAFSSGMGQTLLSKSPLHAWIDSPWNPNRERDDSNTADLGTYAHAMLLEGEHSGLVVVDAADWRTNAAKAQRDEARAQGKLAILAHKLTEVEKMVNAAKEFIANSEIPTIFDSGAAEQTILFDLDGVKCKARPDWMNSERRVVLSYKTTAGSAQPNAWIRTQLPGYDLGIVLYERAANAVLGCSDAQVITLVQEQSAPFSCSLIGLDPAWHALAESKLIQSIGIWRECLKSGKFPGYSSRIHWAEPKPWMLAEAEEQQLEGAIADPAILWEKP